ncbi:MAG: sugar ABC transporter substrate-binding protein [Eubacterium sp.]|nr:sugar ABC transporter substrate-binding protein [Eubacterium sp.]
MRRTWRTGLSVFLLCGLMLGCGSRGQGTAESSAAAAESGSAAAADSGKEEDRIRIGFVVKENGRDHWLRMQASAQEVCDEKGVELLYLAGSGNVVAAEQIEKIDQLIEEDVDAICVAPISDEMLYPALRRAADKEIPVFAVDTDTALEDKVAYIGTNNYEAAKAGAVFAANELGNTGTAVILRGTLGDSTHDERAEGIADGLTENGIEVMETCFSSPAGAKEDVRKLMQRYPDLSLFITTEDEITWNAWQMILASGKTSVSLYGFDGMLEIAELTGKDSQVIGTTAQFPEEIGRLCVETVLAYLDGKQIDKTTEVPWQIIDADNADTYCDTLRNN